MAYTSTAATAEAVELQRELADDVVAAVEGEIAGGASVFTIATAAGIVPSDLEAFLGPNAGDNTFPQHQELLEPGYASQILGGLAGDRTISYEISAAPV